MTFDELCEAAKKATFVEADIEAIKKYLQEAAKEYEARCKQREMTEEALNLVITI
jgi:predicted HicB family RNase H-like nuclease